MGLFKKLANFARNSNQRWSDRMDERYETASYLTKNPEDGASCSLCRYCYGSYCMRDSLNPVKITHTDSVYCDEFEHKDYFG